MVWGFSPFGARWDFEPAEATDPGGHYCGAWRCSQPAVWLLRLPTSDEVLGARCEHHEPRGDKRTALPPRPRPS